MKRQTIIIILTVLILMSMVNANPYAENKPDNVWEKRFQQILAQQEIQKEAYEKLKKSATQEVFYREYGGAFERYGEVILDNAGLFTIKVKGPKQLKAGEKAVIRFYLGNMFNKKYFGINEILDENIDLMKRGIIKNGLLSFIVPQGKIYVDYDHIELTYFQQAIDIIVPHNLNTPKKILQRDNIRALDAETATEYFLQKYFKQYEYEKLSRFEEATKKVIEYSYDEMVSWAINKIPIVSELYTVGKIFNPYAKLLIEYITENKIAIEKSKLDLLKMLAKDRNAYNLFDIPIVLNEKIIGTEDPIMAMVITIPIEVKEEFEPEDKMGFYFDGCLGEDQELERSEYYEWELKEWGRLSGNDPVEAGEMVLVRAGTFQMGDEYGDLWDSCRPVRTVNLTYDYYIGKTEITNEDYLVYLNDSDVNSDGSANGKEHFDMYDEDCEIGYRSGAFYLKEGDEQAPVIMITWWGAIAYCNWLSESEGLAKAYDNNGNLLDKYRIKTTDITKVEGYRLPTEAEWEYAARGGHKSTGDYKYAGSNSINNVAWYDDNSNNKTQEVGQKSPNELGLYDMSGNVWEWCHDWWGSYTNTTKTNPTGLTSASYRVKRGGSWGYGARRCRVAYRDYYGPDSSSRYVGLRIARTRD